MPTNCWLCPVPCSSACTEAPALPRKNKNHPKSHQSPLETNWGWYPGAAGQQGWCWGQWQGNTLCGTRGRAERSPNNPSELSQLPGAAPLRDCSRAIKPRSAKVTGAAKRGFPALPDLWDDRRGLALPRLPACSGCALRGDPEPLGQCHPLNAPIPLSLPGAAPGASLRQRGSSWPCSCATVPSPAALWDLLVCLPSDPQKF